MQDLKKNEQFELEILDKLNSGRFLTYLVFGGGTMLRLCYGLDRYSVDLDFWVVKKINFNKLFSDLKTYIGQFYTLTDTANKFYTILLEVKSPNYPRALKIEIRKEIRKIKTASAIAYSPDANIQVLLKVVALSEMMRAKIEAFLNRKEIRDVYDIEFLIKKGVDIETSPENLNALLKEIENLTQKDYTVKLGSLLEPIQRKYYKSENFKILTFKIKEMLSEKSSKAVGKYAEY
ncbi:MAG: nucleotidyl transferase AbiEii/AbiGii toxin family protein [bacterium]